MAHGTAFFEFNPDASQGLASVSGSDVYEIFLPQNDFLRGFDLWLENHGPAGYLTLELFDGLSQLVAQKTFAVSTTSVEGGQRTHFDFDQLFPVVGNKSYALKISSSLPELLLYYANRVRLLEYNAPFADQYINGVARLDAEEKEFSFKFALYESQEQLPPVISNRSVTALGEGKMRLDFNANEPVDYAVFWGLPGEGYSQNLPLTGSYQFCGVAISVCSAILQGTPGKTYDYQLTAKDSWGNEKSVTGTFTIPAGAAPSATFTPTPISSLTSSVTPVQTDTTPPVISNLRVVEATDHSVEIAWQTNEAADSSLHISFTTELLSIAAAYDNTVELEHILNSGTTLNQSTPYLATVTSRDPANNAASASISFTTAKLSLAVTPVPSATPLTTSTPNNWTLASPLVTSGPGTSSSGNLQITVPAEENGAVVISWTLPVDAQGLDGYRIDIFNDKHELVRSITVPAGAKKQTISDLPQGEYQAVVYANDKGVFRKVARSTSFSIDQRSLADKLFASWLYLAGPLVILLLGVLRFLRKKTPVRKSTAS